MEDLRLILQHLKAIDHTHESDYGHADADSQLVATLQAMPALIVGQPGMREVAEELINQIIAEYDAIPKWYA